MNKKIVYSVFALITTLTLPAVGLAEPANLALLKQELINYHDSGQYLQEFSAVTQQATEYIQHEVDLNQQQIHPKHLAIVLDIDETSLSNFANMRRDDFANNSAKITQEMLAANEPALEPMLNLYQRALQNGVAVFFITGRHQSLRDATVRNLRSAGYANWSGLSLRNQHIPTIAYKSAEREKISQKGFTIIASLGDQMSDCTGGYAQRCFKLPNPFYFLS